MVLLQDPLHGYTYSMGILTYYDSLFVPISSGCLYLILTVSFLSYLWMEGDVSLKGGRFEIISYLVSGRKI